MLKRIWLLLLLITAPAIFAPVPASATTYIFAPGGNDANPCTLISPCQTPQHATAIAVADDTVQFRGGIYPIYTLHSNGLPWTLGTANSGTSGHPITYMAYPGETPIVTGTIPNNGVLPAWTVDPSVNCGTGCTAYVVSLDADPSHASHYVNFHDLYYGTCPTGQPCSPAIRLSRPAGNHKNADLNTNLIAAPGNPMCQAGATQAAANTACNCPLGLNCAFQSTPCTCKPGDATCDTTKPWMCFNKMTYSAGHVDCNWHGFGLGDVEIPLFEIWTMGRFRGKSCATENTANVLYLTGPASLSSGNSGSIPGHQYMVENVLELASPGTWYLDRCPGCAAGVTVPALTWKLYIFADATKNPNQDVVFFPQVPYIPGTSGSLLFAEGVNWVNFTGITFEGDNWYPDPQGLPDTQGMELVPEAVLFSNSSHINWDQMQIYHTSGWGMGVVRASTNWNITNGVINDTGAGGLRIGYIMCPSAGSKPGCIPDTDTNIPSQITISNMAINNGGRTQSTGEATGIYVGAAHHFTITHNDVLGWYAGSINVCHGLDRNRTGGTTFGFCHDYDVNYNHISGVCNGADCQALMSDIGGIYAAPSLSSLCPAACTSQNGPGTTPANFCGRIDHNYIHDIASNYNDTSHRGATGIYIDQGGSCVYVGFNVVARTSQEGFFTNTASNPNGGNPSNFAAIWLPPWNLFINNLFVFPGSSRYPNNSRAMSTGSIALHRFNSQSNIFVINSGVGTQFQLTPNPLASIPHWEPFDQSQMVITAGGTGYSAFFAVTFSGGGCTNTPQAQATAVAGIVTIVNLTNSGAGCTSAPTPSFAAGGGAGATVTVTLSAQHVIPGPAVSVSPDQAFGFVSNDYFDIARKPLSFVTCKTTDCSPTGPGVNTFAAPPFPWANTEDVGGGNSDPCLSNPIYPNDNFFPTCPVSQYGFTMWDYRTAGRSSPVIPVVAVPNLFPLRTINSLTDYAPGYAPSAATVYGTGSGAGTWSWGGSGAGGSDATNNKYCQAGDLINFGAASDGPALLPTQCYFTQLSATPSPGAVRAVTDATTFAAQMTAAACGDVLEVPKGTAITAPNSAGLVILNKSCDAAHYITIRSSGYLSLPPEGTRLTPCYSGVASLPGRPPLACTSTVVQTAKLKAVSTVATSDQVITFNAGASYYRFIGIEFERASGNGNNALQAYFGNGGIHHIIFDRVWAHGNATDETSRFAILSPQGGATANNHHIAFVDSTLTDYWCLSVLGVCTDAQAVAIGSDNALATPDSTFKFVNNFMEGAAETILSGGGAAISTPTDIEVRRNHFFKPLTWNPADPSYIGVPISARVFSTLAGPYNIDATNNTILLSINGAANQTVTLTQGVARTATQVCSDISAVTSATMTCTVSGTQTLRLDTLLKGPTASITFVTVANSAYTVLGFTVGTTSGSNLGQIIVKNLFELKNADRALIEGNVMQNTWGGFSQVGGAILLTPANQANGTLSLCPLCFVTNVTIRNNWVTTAAQFGQFNNLKNINGQMATAGNKWSIHGNVAENLLYPTCNGCTTGTATVALLEDTAPSASMVQHDVTVDHNTIVYAAPGIGTGIPNAFLGLSGATIASGLNQHDMTVTNNAVLAGPAGTQNSFGGAVAANCACLWDGTKCTNAKGKPMLDACWLPYTFGGNMLIGGGSIQWPGVNCTTETTQTGAYTDFHNGWGGNYRLLSSSLCKGKALDGTDPGADISATQAATNGVATNFTDLNGLVGNDTSACSASGIPSYCTGAVSGWVTDAGHVGAQTPTFNPTPVHVNVSNLRAHLYTGSTTRFLSHIQPWFCKASDPCNGHKRVWYDSADPLTVNAQSDMMLGYGMYGAVMDFYGTTDGAQVVNLNAAVAWKNFLNGCFTTSCPLHFGLMEDKGAFETHCPSGATDRTACIIGDLTTDMDYVNANFAGTAWYLKDTVVSRCATANCPMMFFFIHEASWSGTDWNGPSGVWATLKAHTDAYAVKFEYVFEHEDNTCWTHTQGGGCYAFMNPPSWQPAKTIAASGAVRLSNVSTFTTTTVHTLTAGDHVSIAGVTYGGATSFNIASTTVATVIDTTHFTIAQTGENGTGSGGTSTNIEFQYYWGQSGGTIPQYYIDFLVSAKATPSRIPVMMLKAGFDDSRASWGVAPFRVGAKRCGRTFRDIASLIGNYFSTSTQLEYAAIMLNDFEEGTELETGQDNCYTPSLSITGNTANWSLSTSDPIGGFATINTIQQFDLYYSDGVKYYPLVTGLPNTSTSQPNLDTLVPKGTYTIYTYMMGKPTFFNRLSNGVIYTH